MRRLLIAVCSLTLLVACNPNQPKSDINLNNGEKWEVNSEMKPHIEKGNKLLFEFISTQDKDYQKLAKNLKAQNNALIQSCTMKGESHDELHKWLHPHMQLIENLSNAKSFDQAEGVVTELETSFKTYQNYFE